jgi:hypothetical protein
VSTERGGVARVPDDRWWRRVQGGGGGGDGGGSFRLRQAWCGELGSAALAILYRNSICLGRGRARAGVVSGFANFGDSLPGLAQEHASERTEGGRERGREGEPDHAHCLPCWL